MEEEIHFSILACKIPLKEEPGGYSPWGHKRVRQDLATKERTKRGRRMLLLRLPPHEATEQVAAAEEV